MYKLSQSEMMLQCNVISHWQSRYPEWSLHSFPKYNFLFTLYFMCASAQFYVLCLHKSHMDGLVQLSTSVTLSNRDTLNASILRQDLIAHMYTQDTILVHWDRHWSHQIGDGFSLLYPTQQSWGGVYWIHPVRPSVCPSVCPSVRPSVRGSVSGW